MIGTLVLGVDPGPTTGMVALLFTGPDAMADLMVLQCDHYSALFFARAIIHEHLEYRLQLAVEQFVVGPRSARSGTAAAGRVTRNLIGAFDEEFGRDVTLRAAGQVKPWATDRMLDAAGLLAPTAGMNHARDASRHALFAAVHSGIAHNPMSKAAAR